MPAVFAADCDACFTADVQHRENFRFASWAKNRIGNVRKVAVAQPQRCGSISRYGMCLARLVVEAQALSQQRRKFPPRRFGKPGRRHVRLPTRACGRGQKRRHPQGLRQPAPGRFGGRAFDVPANPWCHGASLAQKRLRPLSSALRRELRMWPAARRRFRHRFPPPQGHWCPA